MVIIVKGFLDTLKTFVAAMACGNDVLEIDINKKDEIRWEELSEIDENTVVITFNNIGSGFELWKKANVKLYNILVDHPAYYIKTIVNDFYEGYHAVCIDRKHVEFLQEIFPKAKDSFMFLPHGGLCINADTGRRDIDVLYAGGFMSEDEINFPLLPFEHDSEGFYEFLFADYENNSSSEPQDVVKRYAKQFGLKLNAEQYYIMTYYALGSVELAYLAQRRINIIERMAASGINVHLCGPKVWEPIAAKYPEQITYHGMLSPKECLELIARSKVLINDHPNFADGSHERVFNGMLNGAVVLSNESIYLSERFEDGRDILFWDGNDCDSAVMKVKKVLEDDSLREEIVKNACSKVQKDTWSDRLKELINS